MSKYETLNGKVVVILWWCQKFGCFVKWVLRKEGAKIVVHHHNENSKQQAEATLEKIKSLGSEGTLFSGDLTEVKNVEALFKHAESTFGKVDIAINTVGKVLKNLFLK